MQELQIKVDKKYKSFEQGFNSSINGDLVILSGVNGSGKSQLLSIIYGQESKELATKIDSKILLGGEKININDIDFRTFKDNTNIPELTPSNSQTYINSSNAAWHKYTNDRLDPLSPNNLQFSDSCIFAKKILIESFGEKEFIQGKIPEEQFKSKLSEQNFIWRNGDKFTNSIGEIFFNHCLNVSEIMKEVGKANFHPGMLEKAPWKILNELFQKLNLEYRFKEDYFIKGVEINEQPKLFPVNTDGSINYAVSRFLHDLSDGEKTIISLCFASLIGNKFAMKRLLLLDEVDSVLNPSLIEMFFEVIDEFFIKKGIMVIMSTHSPATISLSPSYTRFYEVFKPNKSGSRLLEVDRNDYAELLIANRNFYAKINNQQKRINDLEKTINSNSDILIVTEGKSDWKYFISALRYFHSKNRFIEIKEEYFYRFGTIQDFNNKICDTKEVNELSESKLKNYLTSLKTSREIDVSNLKIRLGIFDSDTNITFENDLSKNVFSYRIKPNGISTEFLFKDEEIKTIINGKRLFIGDEFDSRSKRHKTENYNLGGESSNINKAGKRTIIETDVYNNKIENVAISKEKFAQEIYNEKIEICEESWNNFVQVFDFITSILPNKDNQVEP